MKLLITTVAGVALIALAGCNRAAPANNAATNATDNAAAPAEAGAKPADANAAAPAEEAAAPGGGKPADGAAADSAEDDQPADQANQSGK
jgi:hypothetical protein